MTARAFSYDNASVRARLQELTDDELMGRYLEGEEMAFEVLVTRYQIRLLSLINRMIGDRAKAEDLVQETLLRVYRHAKAYDPKRKFSTWVYGIALNLAKNELRNRGRSPLILFSTITDNQDEDAHLQFEDATTRPDDMFYKRHLRTLVEDAVTKLPEHHRRTFVLREFKGKSFDQIARIQGCNVDTVKSRMNRARNAFARIIEPLID